MVVTEMGCVRAVRNAAGRVGPVVLTAILTIAMPLSAGHVAAAPPSGGLPPAFDDGDTVPEAFRPTVPVSDEDDVAPTAGGLAEALYADDPSVDRVDYYRSVYSFLNRTFDNEPFDRVSFDVSGGPGVHRSMLKDTPFENEKVIDKLFGGGFGRVTWAHNRLADGGYEIGYGASRATKSMLDAHAYIAIEETHRGIAISHVGAPPRTVDVPADTPTTLPDILQPAQMPHNAPVRIHNVYADFRSDLGLVPLGPAARVGLYRDRVDITLDMLETRRVSDRMQVTRGDVFLDIEQPGAVALAGISGVPAAPGGRVAASRQTVRGWAPNLIQAQYTWASDTASGLHDPATGASTARAETDGRWTVAPGVAAYHDDLRRGTPQPGADLKHIEAEFGLEAGISEATIAKDTANRRAFGHWLSPDIFGGYGEVNATLQEARAGYTASNIRDIAAYDGGGRPDDPAAVVSDLNYDVGFTRFNPALHAEGKAKVIDGVVYNTEIKGTVGVAATLTVDEYRDALRAQQGSGAVALQVGGDEVTVDVETVRTWVDALDADLDDPIEELRGRVPSAYLDPRNVTARLDLADALNRQLHVREIPVSLDQNDLYAMQLAEKAGADPLSVIADRLPADVRNSPEKLASVRDALLDDGIEAIDVDERFMVPSTIDYTTQPYRMPSPPRPADLAVGHDPATGVGDRADDGGLDQVGALEQASDDARTGPEPFEAPLPSPPRPSDLVAPERLEAPLPSPPRPSDLVAPDDVGDVPPPAPVAPSTAETGFAGADCPCSPRGYASTGRDSGSEHFSYVRDPVNGVETASYPTFSDFAAQVGETLSGPSRSEEGSGGTPSGGGAGGQDHDDDDGAGGPAGDAGTADVTDGTSDHAVGTADGSAASDTGAGGAAATDAAHVGSGSIDDTSAEAGTSVESSDGDGSGSTSVADAASAGETSAAGAGAGGPSGPASDTEDTTSAEADGGAAVGGAATGGVTNDTGDTVGAGANGSSGGGSAGGGMADGAGGSSAGGGVTGGVTNDTGDTVGAGAASGFGGTSSVSGGTAMP